MGVAARCTIRHQARLQPAVQVHWLATIELTHHPAMPQRPQLTLDPDLFENHDDESDKLLTTFRQDGLSIGQDYLRLEGATFARGQRLLDCLETNELIGRGAFSKVYKGTWTNSPALAQEDHPVPASTTVAVKMFPIDSAARRNEMLIKELRTLVEIQRSLRASTQCLIQLHGAFLQNDCVAMVLEYMDRGSLDDWLKDRTMNLPPDAMASLAFQTLNGLSALHAVKILHRDLKPANILLDSIHGAVKLADFGLVSNASSASSLNMTVLGTSKFMSPERLRGRAYGRSSDMWSFGLCLLQCLTLEPPWVGVHSLVELLITVEETLPDDMTAGYTIEPGLLEMIHVCLQKDACTFS